MEAGEGNGTLLQYSCLENPMDRGAWSATGVAKSWTQLKQLSTHKGRKDKIAKLVQSKIKESMNIVKSQAVNWGTMKYLQCVEPT